VSPGRHLSKRLGSIVDRPWYVVLGLVVVAFTWWAIGTRHQPHHVKASFASAFNLVSGQAVSVDGLEVGKIGGVRYDHGKALVDIGISDGHFWPLHVGTRVVSRWGTTIGSGTRRLDLYPGPGSAPVLSGSAVIPTADTEPAVDVDQVLNTFTPGVRTHLRHLVGAMDAGFSGQTKQLSAALHTSAGGVRGTGGLMSDLASDTYALHQVVTNADRLTATLSARSQGVQDLITVAATTFQTFAQNTRGTQASISELPGTLRQAHSTLQRVDSSVNQLNRLMVALAPGARRLRPLAAQAQPALAQLRQTVPSAVATVATATTAAPHITSLMNAATPFMQTAPGVFGDLAPMVSCLRPYAPELGGALVGGGGSHQNYDVINPKLNPQIVRYVGIQRPNGTVEQHGLRATPMVSVASVETPLNSAAFAKVSGKLYADPRPPGLTTGQPRFIPECGITKDALNPAKDPESP
jgi:ABC-type transporter Mla subunit MlaD